MNFRFLCIFIVIIFVFSLVGCASSDNDIKNIASNIEESADHMWTESPNTEDNQADDNEIKTDKELEAQIDVFIGSMTLEEKIAQLFIVTPESLTGGQTVTQTDDAFRQAFDNFPVGGIVYFDINLISTEQTQQMLKDFQSFSNERIGLPLLNCVDEEGGSVIRIANKSGFDAFDVGNMWSIGATGDSSLAYDAGRIMGRYLSDLGFNINFAPVADVLTNSKNKVIGKRSFGSDPDTVAQMVVAELEGLGESNVTGVVKHFPGHGATTGDTHKGQSFTEKSLENMLTSELVPFQAAIDEGVSVIMVGHFSAPNVTRDNTPCSLSEVIITQLLREQMAFDGLVITDALNMEAITQIYDSASAAVKALKAGSDLLLMPDNFNDAFTGVLEAVNSGELSQGRINESLKRILVLKLSLNPE